MNRRPPHAGAHRLRRLCCATAASVVAAATVIDLHVQGAALRFAIPPNRDGQFRAATSVTVKAQ
jgi:hypothetical protein